MIYSNSIRQKNKMQKKNEGFPPFCGLIALRGLFYLFRLLAATAFTAVVTGTFMLSATAFVVLQRHQ